MVWRQLMGLYKITKRAGLFQSSGKTSLISQVSTESLGDVRARHTQPILTATTAVQRPSSCTGHHRQSNAWCCLIIHSTWYAAADMHACIPDEQDVCSHLY